MNLRTVETPHWKSFTDAFSRAHDGWVGALRVREGDSSRTEVEEGAFRGATIESRGGHDTLILTFGYEPEEHFAHIIKEPRGLKVFEALDGTEATLQVDGDERSCVLDLANPLREEDFFGA